MAIDEMDRRTIIDHVDNRANFNPYAYCMKRWCLDRSQIDSIKVLSENRKFVTYELKWSVDDRKEREVFKIMAKKVNKGKSFNLRRRV